MLPIFRPVKKGAISAPYYAPVNKLQGLRDRRAADEVDALSASSMIVRMFLDYAVLRDEAGACR